MAQTTVPVSAEPTLIETNPGGSAASTEGWQARFSAFADQPAFRRAVPALIGVGALAVVAMLYLAIAGSPQRILYASLSDSERAQVVEALETGAIDYAIDTATGAITVAEDDIYRARMLVASDAGLAAPQGASEMLDAIPLGSSRTLEGERLRLARERELTLTIREIDGIESVRVHLATPERSVFVRNSNPPSASVMVRLVSGRSLSQRQVEAIVNLVSGSVPGLTADAVRVVDQNGRLLSSARDAQADGLALQREFEAKLQSQLAGLLTPLLGEGNFTSQVQAELDQSEVTSARETYDKEGALRSESERRATRVAARPVGGVPGVPANTPPPDAELVNGPPEPEAPGAETPGGTEAPTPGDTESAVQRNFELDREVAVTAKRAGSLARLSVAVAVSQDAMAAAAPLTPEELEALVSAALGIDEKRGDTVKIAVSAFEATALEPLAFYEQAWFAQVVRYGTALIAVLLALLFGVRPLIARTKPKDTPTPDVPKPIADQSASEPKSGEVAGASLDQLPGQVRLARTLANEQPDRALEALQRMLQPPAQTSEQGAG
ncbi:MAG: flagellar basal-body MS-ring/collar protein FliF [Erythrobacter sp.]|uniref:flagellar basal-body MS-ring/collar protein FliF n=1 Tax=Erythrobacter sp. TaxID=1042 RepID=UPI002614EEE4|nr:flagellar basal-body MS-ring/collar protein FliF [Erythrobacter sp.]MDJ0979141.1 flagellar basal-body MS-ring/collar protein FliF [Erythrobacter sp.]